LPSTLPSAALTAAKRAPAESDEETLGSRIVPDVVGIVSEPNRLGRMVVARIDALDVTVVRQIEHFHRVVAKCRDVQAVRGRFDGQMIDATLDPGKINRGDERERRLARCG
jgi:hypothetical protein